MSIKNALLIAMKQKGLKVEVERSFEVVFRGNVIWVETVEEPVSF